MIVDYKNLCKTIKGTSIPKPLSGTLSGHAAGEPFDKHVYAEIKKQFPENTFRQYEYLNDLFSKNPDAIRFKARQALFNSPTILFLLGRGKEAAVKWRIEKNFEEKQNDTADILVVKDNFYDLLDIKTRNISKSAQPPNIISAYKLAQLCVKMINNKEFDNFTFNYFEIDWKLENDKLICKDTHFACLFNTNPINLYINWAAGMQIQFHVCNLDQTFNGTREQWAKFYLEHFAMEARKRADYMITKFAKPFEKYIE